MNSEDRMNRIVGNVKSESDSNGTLTSTSRLPHSVLHRPVSLRRPRSLDQCSWPRILNDMAMCTNSDTISLFFWKTEMKLSDAGFRLGNRWAFTQVSP